MTPVKNIMTVRVSDAVAEEVRTLAEDAEVRPSVVLRRLIRLGLQRERASMQQQESGRRG